MNNCGVLPFPRCPSWDLWNSTFLVRHQNIKPTAPSNLQAKCDVTQQPPVDESRDGHKNQRALLAGQQTSLPRDPQSKNMIAHLSPNVRRNHKKKFPRRLHLATSCNSGREARAAPVGMEQTCPASHSVVAPARLSTGAMFPTIFQQPHHWSCRLQLCRWYVFPAFRLRHSARDKDNDSHGTDDGDHIADNDADDVTNF